MNAVPHQLNASVPPRATVVAPDRAPASGPDPAVASASSVAASAREPSRVDLLIDHACALHSRARHAEALLCIGQACALSPDNPRALNMRGMMLDTLDRHEEALADFELALQINPGFPDAINNRGIHYARAGCFEQALACYERSLALAPQQPQTLYNRATTRLALGDWLRGFHEFESRWRIFPLEAARLNRLKPVWLGECDVAGKILLLHHEQGYGDTLQFSRYVSLVIRLGARVIVAVPAALRRLMQTLPGAPQIVSEGDPIPPHDYCCSLMSLPHVFCTTTDSVPAEIPYLRAAPEAARTWAERLGPRTRPRIGLVWSGRRYPPINYPRDMSLELIRPLLTLAADFVVLQPEVSLAERAILSAAPNAIRYGDVFEDFADTAALIQNIDLVITVDSAVAHLAGALGKPVWLMNRYASCWRWLQKRSDSPWYPQLRLFRQPVLGDWASVVSAVRDAAARFVADAQVRYIASEGERSSVAVLLNAALARYHQGDLERALDDYRCVLALDPLQPEALHYLGVTLARLARYEEALEALSLVLRLQPQNATAYNHRGNILAALSRLEEALVNYDHALMLDGGFAEAHYHRGLTLATLGRPEAALVSYRRAVALRPDHAEAHNNFGNTLVELDRHEEALECYGRACDLRNDFNAAWVNRANTLRRLGRYDSARLAAEHVLGLEPGHAEAHSALGATLAGQGLYEDALSHYQSALALQPALAEAAWNKALAHLARGELREGWLEYETRWKVKSLRLTGQYSAQPPWLGREPLEGKTILAHAEQGYGDTIQFCRYVPLLAARGARVVLGVPRALHPLMITLEGAEEVVSRSPIPPFDYHCPLLSLPLACGTELTTIPASVPYLQADATLRERWGSRLASDSRPRVGLVWSGRVTHSNDANRSIALESLMPLLRDDIQWVSAQKDTRPADVSLLTSVHGIRRYGEELTDFADAAALLDELDLLISVDTAIAHLAGALGKPVWILLPHVADWRWLQARDDSPWYPTARLFRQPAAADWDSVIQKVAVELDRFCELNPRHT